MKKIYLSLPVPAIALLFMSFMFADDLHTYEVSGRLIDSDSNAVAGHPVRLLDADKLEIASGESDDQGNFLLTYQAEATSSDPFDDLQTPSEFRLGSSYPNPFNPVTTIPFHAPRETHAVIGVYDILGRRVMQTDARVDRGTHHIVINLGSGLSQGQYLVRVRGNGFSLVQGMTFISVGVSSGTTGITLRPGTGEVRADIAPDVSSDYYTTSSLHLIMGDTDYFMQRQVMIPSGQSYHSGELVLVRNRKVAGDGVTDIDGNEYSTVIIGDQEWMAENLKVTRYRDGTEIQMIPDTVANTEWRDATSGAMTVYPYGSVFGLESEEEVLEGYGRLYNWHAVGDTLGLCPEGWRVPTVGDWDELLVHLDSLGYPNVAGVVIAAGNALKSRLQEGSPLGIPWDNHLHPRWGYFASHYGMDIFGFSARPNGYRLFNGTFSLVGVYGYWWTSTEVGANVTSITLYHGGGNVVAPNITKQFGCAVRCVKE